MNKSFKRLSLFAMFALSSVFAYVSYVFNKSNSQNTLADIFGANIAEGAACTTVLSCLNGTGSGSGSSSGGCGG